MEKIEPKNSNTFYCTKHTPTMSITNSINLHNGSAYEDDKTFGTLSIVAESTSTPTPSSQTILFNIDVSGSMSDECSDRRSKMQHIVHTLKNMVHCLSQIHPSPKIQINTFHTKVATLVYLCIVKPDTVDSIIEAIDTLRPLESTNIELALTHASTFIDANIAEQVTHVFMTDGDATAGSANPTALQEILNPNVPNIFIGFGVDHNYSTLKTLASVYRARYYFVDKIENAGLVYGEILHSILYKLQTDVELTIQNGLVYNWKNNEWTTTILIDQIVSEQNITYQLKTQNPDELCVSLRHQQKTNFVYPEQERKDLTNYLYRQATQELLYRASNEPYSRSLKNEIVYLLTKLKDMNSDDPLIKVLSDDLYVANTTYGTQRGQMYAGARQSSQGTQQIYGVTTDGAADHTFTQFEDSQFVSPGRVQLMRSVSRPVDSNASTIVNAQISSDEDHVFTQPVLRRSNAMQYSQTPNLY